MEIILDTLDLAELEDISIQHLLPSNRAITPHDKAARNVFIGRKLISKYNKFLDTELDQGQGNIQDIAQIYRIIRLNQVLTEEQETNRLILAHDSALLNDLNNLVLKAILSLNVVLPYFDLVPEDLNDQLTFLYLFKELGDLNRQITSQTGLFERIQKILAQICLDQTNYLLENLVGLSKINTDHGFYIAQFYGYSNKVKQLCELDQQAGVHLDTQGVFICTEIVRKLIPDPETELEKLTYLAACESFTRSAIWTKRQPQSLDNLENAHSMYLSAADMLDKVLRRSEELTQSEIIRFRLQLINLNLEMSYFTKAFEIHFQNPDFIHEVTEHYLGSGQMPSFEFASVLAWYVWLGINHSVVGSWQLKNAIQQLEVLEGYQRNEMACVEGQGDNIRKLRLSVFKKYGKHTPSTPDFLT